jgi:hypothetical protein
LLSTRISVQRKVLIVKNVLGVIVLLLSMVVASDLRTANAEKGTIASDGEYTGLESMPNLTPEDPDASWFHENRLVIRNDEAILDKVPISIRHRKKVYSASDGGFLTYRAKVIIKDGQTFIELRLFQSDYIAFPKDLNGKDRYDPYAQIRTDPIKLASGRIEFDGVTYKPAVLDKIELDRLVHLLSTEPLEKANGGR